MATLPGMDLRVPPPAPPAGRPPTGSMGNPLQPFSLPPLRAAGPGFPYGSGARSAPRLGSHSPAGGPTYGPMGLTPMVTPRGSPSPPRARSTTRREREDRAGSREERRAEAHYEEQRAQSDVEGRVRDWVARLMAVEQAQRNLAQYVVRT